MKVFRKEHQLDLLNAIQGLGKESAPIRNHSLARSHYLRSLGWALGSVSFEGFGDEVEQTSVDCPPVFVMPSLTCGVRKRRRCRALQADPMAFR